MSCLSDLNIEPWTVKPKGFIWSFPMNLEAWLNLWPTISAPTSQAVAWGGCLSYPHLLIVGGRWFLFFSRSYKTADPHPIKRPRDLRLMVPSKPPSKATTKYGSWNHPRAAVLVLRIASHLPRKSCKLEGRKRKPPHQQLLVIDLLYLCEEQLSVLHTYTKNLSQDLNMFRRFLNQ